MIATPYPQKILITPFVLYILLYVPMHILTSIFILFSHILFPYGIIFSYNINVVSTVPLSIIFKIYFRCILVLA